MTAIFQLPFTNMADMADKKITLDNLESLGEVVGRLVEMQTQYFQQGFTLEQVAQLFAQLFFIQFKSSLSPQVISSLDIDDYSSEKPSNADAAGSACLRMATAFIGVVTEQLAQVSARQDHLKARDELEKVQAEYTDTE